MLYSIALSTVDSSHGVDHSRCTMTEKTSHFIKRLKIVVTQQDIDEAHRAKSNGCMIQQALKRDHPEFKNIWVDKNQIRCTDPEKNCIYTFEMPPRGRVMLLKWDSGETVSPVELWARNPVVRERTSRSSTNHPVARRVQQTAKTHVGPVPRPNTKEARLHSGRDRVFGLKRWADELAKLRSDLGVST